MADKNTTPTQAPETKGGQRLRESLVGLLAAALFIWSANDYSPLRFSRWSQLEGLSSPFLYGLWAVSLVVPPVALWHVLAYVWRVWQPDAAAEDRLQRTVAGAVAGALLLGAILLAQSANRHNGTLGFILLLFAPFAFWHGLSEPEESRKTREALSQAEFDRNYWLKYPLHDRKSQAQFDRLMGKPARWPKLEALHLADEREGTAETALLWAEDLESQRSPTLGRRLLRLLK
ncbi:MAG: hypothetical protein EXR51_01110 [Dehalococcoidia bacterium]|nr:hypothetical protein [Dehalococcoidia bacterium]